MNRISRMLRRRPFEQNASNFSDTKEEIVRIYHASDLHVDIKTGMQTTRSMASYLKAHATDDDVLLLGGDYANDDLHVRACMALFRDVPGTKLGVGGNHDVWTDPRTAQTSQERQAVLSRVFTDTGFFHLEDGPFCTNGVGFVGSMGWYDYTLKDPVLQIADDAYRTKQCPKTGRCWYGDGTRVDWEEPDATIVDRKLAQLERHIARISDRVGMIVALLHHAPTRDLIYPNMVPEVLVRRFLPKKKRMVHALLGSERFRQLFSAWRNVRVVFSGHMHAARSIVREGVHYIANGSNHRKKELVIWERGSVVRKIFTA